MNIRRAAPLNCARVCFQTVLSSAVTFNSIPQLSITPELGELLLAESLTGPTIASVVERALIRARISSTHRGANLLRHSLATRMLRGGASLTQIGQILRHQRTDTTEIYARVDQKNLRALAQPWPGGVR